MYRALKASVFPGFLGCLPSEEVLSAARRKIPSHQLAWKLTAQIPVRPVGVSISLYLCISVSHPKVRPEMRWWAPLGSIFTVLYTCENLLTPIIYSSSDTPKSQLPKFPDSPGCIAHALCVQATDGCSCACLSSPHRQSGISNHQQVVGPMDTTAVVTPLLPASSFSPSRSSQSILCLRASGLECIESS